MEKKKKSPLIYLLTTLTVVTLSYCSVLAETWYVAPASMGGNDNNSGTSPSDPWEHISYAAIQVSPGDTIKVLDDDNESTDDYIENVSIFPLKIGLVIERYDDVGPNPQVKAEDPSIAVFWVSADSVTIRGFDIYGSTQVFDPGIYVANYVEYLSLIHI